MTEQLLETFDSSLNGMTCFQSEVFQEDIYPDTLSGIPSLSCGEWISGETREPILISMKDGAIPFMPKIVTYKQLGYSDLGNNFSRSIYNTNGNHSVGLNRTEKLNGKHGTSSLNGNHSSYSNGTTNGGYFSHKNGEVANSTSGVSTSSTPASGSESPFKPWSNSNHTPDSPSARGSLPVAEVQPSTRIFANKNIYSKALLDLRL